MAAKHADTHDARAQAKCRTCKQQIAKGTIRFKEDRGYDTHSDCAHVEYQHLLCIKKARGAKIGWWSHATWEDVDEAGGPFRISGFESALSQDQRDAVMLARDAPQRKANPRTDPCFKCGEVGHWSRDCPLRKGGSGGTSAAAAAAQPSTQPPAETRKSSRKRKNKSADDDYVPGDED